MLIFPFKNYPTVCRRAGEPLPFFINNPEWQRKEPIRALERTNKQKKVKKGAAAPITLTNNRVRADGTWRRGANSGRIDRPYIDQLTNAARLQRVLAALVVADANCVVHPRQKNLAVADLSRARGVGNGLYHLVHHCGALSM